LLQLQYLNMNVGEKDKNKEYWQQKVKDLKENTFLSVSQIARLTKKSRNKIYKILKNELNYIPYNKLVKGSSICKKKKLKNKHKGRSMFIINLVLKS